MILNIGDIELPENEVSFHPIQSTGPGGQNVNKVATAVQLRFDVVRSTTLPENVRNRLIILAGKRISKGGILVIEAHNHRTQDENRHDALARLIHLIELAATNPRIRIKTRPSINAHHNRLHQKRQKSLTKWLRSKTYVDE